MSHTNTPAGIDVDTIRAVFMRNGFTIKEGQSDLKPYVFAAAHELIALTRASHPAPAVSEQAGGIEKFTIPHVSSRGEVFVLESDALALAQRASSAPADIAHAAVAASLDHARALHAAVSALYFDDSSDFRSALGAVVRHLDPALAGEMLGSPKSAYDHACSRLDAASTATPASASSAPAGDKHLPGWERGIATVTLDGHQLRAALEIVNPDGEADPDQLDDWLTFGIVQHRDDDGNESTGMCCWNDDSDGVMPLNGTAGHDAPASAQPADDLTTAIAYIADELEADAMNHDGDFADTVRGCVDALRHLIEHSPVPSAQPVAAAPAHLFIGVSNNDQGMHINVVQKHADGSATVIYTAQAPAGDSYGHATIAAPVAAAPAGVYVVTDDDLTMLSIHVATLENLASGTIESLGSDHLLKPGKPKKATMPDVKRKLSFVIPWLKKFRARLDAAPAAPVLTLDNAPIGTTAPAIGGGHWYRTENGWKWNGPDGTGGTFPRPGGDWNGELIAPAAPVAQAEANAAEVTAPRSYLNWWTSIETDVRKSMMVWAHREPERLHALVKQAYEAGQQSMAPATTAPVAPQGAQANCSNSSSSSAQGKPVAWIRFRSDGGYEGPIMHAAMEEVRKKSGAWTPLYAPATAQQAEVQSQVQERRETAGGAGAAPGVQHDHSEGGHHD